MSRMGWLGIAVVALLAWSRGGAQQAGPSIVDGVAIEPRGGCQMVRIEFEQPLLYLGHFPTEATTELVLWLRPATLSGDRAARALLKQRVAVALPEGRGALASLVYDGSGQEGPHLLLRFDAPRRSLVRPGADGRSVTILFGTDPATCPAEAAR